MNPYRLLTLSVVAAATLPRLAHRGMFVDGVTYASIARNLSEGRGSFWSPFYTATLYPQFHEHPPLGFWLQSLWFRALGDHLYVERLYSVTAALATAWLMSVVWRASSPSDTRAPCTLRGMDWLPVLFWATVPVVSWAIVGNLLETTVALLTTAAIAAVVRAVQHPSLRVAVVWAAVSGVCVVGAGLTKGPVGLFPLAAPIVMFLWPGRRRLWSVAAAQWVIVLLCAVLLVAWPAARASLTDYVNGQVLAAIAGEREVSASSVTILKELAQGVLLPMAGLALVGLAVAPGFAPMPAGHGRRAVALLLLALAGSLPILFSAKQAGHYLVPAVPVFALAAALVMAPTAARVLRRLDSGSGRATLRLVSAALVLGAIGAAMAPGLGRDRERLANLDAVAPAVVRDTVVGICPEANADWGLHAWFERRFQVGLDATGQVRREWFLKTPSSRSGCPPSSCVAATDPAQVLVLMKCPRAE